MKERESEERLEENQSKLWFQISMGQGTVWLCMNLIMDQAMTENYKFVWYRFKIEKPWD